MKLCDVKMLCLCLLALCLASCERPVALYQFREVDSEVWEPSDTLRFPLDSVGGSGTYKLQALLRIDESNAYPLQNLALRLTPVIDGKSMPPMHATFKIDPIVFLPVRKGTSMTCYVADAGTLYLPKDSQGYIVVQHVMRRWLLEGVNDIGLKLTQTKPKDKASSLWYYERGIFY